MIEVQEPDRIAMSQRERDTLRVLRSVISGERTQAEAARLLKKSVRQVRRMQRNVEANGDGAIVHGLRGQPSNHRCDTPLRKKVLQLYRKKYADFGPTFACEKLATEGLTVGVETLRRWLIAEGLWERKRRRDPHRTRRPRRSCFGELVQMDASIHDWLEGRGETLVLITMIDDATSQILAKFYRSGSVEAHMDLLGDWLRKHGRPLALYTDRHSIFEAHEKGQPLADPDAKTQFGRAVHELDIELIRAHSPQAKGRVERSFGTAQDRWVKELRLAKVKTCEQANELLQRLLPQHNRRFAQAARKPTDAHRRLAPGHCVKSILSIQHERVVSNDYVVRYANRFYQLLKPIYPGLRGGRVVIEDRLDGSRVIRFGKHVLNYEELAMGKRVALSDASRETHDPQMAQQKETRGKARGRRGVTEKKAEKTPPKRKPGDDHPWRKCYK